ncbi:MAG: Gfo/Idh/MocA family oxidoreductase [Kiritimatiellaeota bacterium]|nr:Gfo/Idh/MocA family oxidoreductase [Kiritimatiellota bacterium]
MKNVQVHRVGIIMNGVTGRMGTNQHLLRSIVPIMQAGGIKLSDAEVILPDPVLVGRNPAKLERLAKLSGIEKWTTDLDATLSDPAYGVYFDAQTTGRRPRAVQKAIAAGKHVYCEKPTALTSAEAYGLYCAARDAGVKHGVVQDKLWLPGFLKLKGLRDTGFFGRVLSVRGEFGYWVFDGRAAPTQRPSWNYRKEDGGGIILDMFAHWRYLLDNLFGPVRAVSCTGATLIHERLDENGAPYKCTADDAAYATFALDGDVLAQFNSSWAVRVRRDDLLTVHVDGTAGSAVAGLRKCFVQPAATTPLAVWNPDVDNPHDYRTDWLPAPDRGGYDNAFKAEWQLFLRHVVLDEPFPWDLREGAKGVQLAEMAMTSWKKRRWVDIPELPA